jgi:hypothetical protein
MGTEVGKVVEFEELATGKAAPAATPCSTDEPSRRLPCGASTSFMAQDCALQ